MKVNLLDGEMLSQCPACHAIEVKMDEKRTGYQKTFVIFESLPSKLCYGCQNHVGESNEMVVEKGVDMGKSL